MKGKTKFQTESFIHGERITSHNLLSAPVVFPFMKTIIPSSSPIFNEWDPGICAASRIKFVNETVFSRTEMIFHAAVTIFSVLENTVVESEIILCGTGTTKSGSMKIVVVSEKIIFTMTKIFSVSEKIFAETPAASVNQRVGSLGSQKTFFAIEKIFSGTEMIFCSAEKVFCGTKKILFQRDSIFSGSKRIFPGTNPIFSFIDAIIFIAGKIISAMTTHISPTEKIFFVPDRSFFAAEMMFWAAEKTAGAVPAGLFLNHQPFFSPAVDNVDSTGPFRGVDRVQSGT